MGRAVTTPNVRKNGWDVTLLTGIWGSTWLPAAKTWCFSYIAKIDLTPSTFILLINGLIKIICHIQSSIAAFPDVSCSLSLFTSHAKSLCSPASNVQFYSSILPKRVCLVLLCLCCCCCYLFLLIVSFIGNIYFIFVRLFWKNLMTFHNL